MKQLLFFLLVCSCSVIEREKGYPDGNLGYVADRKLVFAKGHDQRVSRYFLSLVLIAPLIAETAESPIEAKLSAERINAIYGRLGILHNAAKKCHFVTSYTKNILLTNTSQPKNPNECLLLSEDGKLLDSAFAFESLSFDVSRSLAQATKQVYDNLGVRKRLTKFTALNPTDMLKAVLALRHILPTAMKYFATYRDTSQILADSVLDSCQAYYETIDEGEGTATFDQSRSKPISAACFNLKETLVKSVDRSRSVDEDLTKQDRPILEVFDASFSAIKAGLDWQFSKEHFQAVIYHIDRACKVLSSIQSQDENVTVSQCTSSEKGSKAKAYLTALN